MHQHGGKTLESILQVVSIPSIPPIVAKLNEVLDSDVNALDAMVCVVSEDPPLMAHVLRTTNSARYGQREPVLEIKRAAVIIGAVKLRNLVLEASLIRSYPHLERFGLDLDELWKHAILTARVCDGLATTLMLAGRDLLLAPASCYTCGLLHDLGKIVLLDNLEQDYLAVLHHATRNGRPTFESERELLGFDHAQVGAIVASKWGLPDKLVLAIEEHHEASDGAEEPPLIVPLVQLANHIAHQVAEGTAVKVGEKHPSELKQLDLASSAYAQALSAAKSMYASISI